MTRGRASTAIRRALAWLLVLAAPLAAAQEAWRFHAPGRVVVVADVHGAYDQLSALLRATGVVDGDLHWSGGDTQLVSLGDLLDRGSGSRAVLDLLMRLQTEASAADGRVHVVLGNHELMNLIGDLRYVSAAEYAAFAADESDAMRDAAFAAQPPAAALTREEFERRYPRGYFAHRAAFASDGHYGQWLLSLGAIVVIDDTAFVHGGLPQLVADETLGQLDAAVQAKLHRYLELRDELAAQGVLHPFDMQRDPQTAATALESAAGPIKVGLEEFIALAEAPELGSDGPLWYRGSIYCKPLLELPVLERALAKLEVGRVVVGHTPTDDRRVHALYGGKLIMLDTGMLTTYYDGRPAALVLEGGGARAHYLEPDEQAAVEILPSTSVAYGLSDAELEDALREAVAVEHDPTESGAWNVSLERGELKMQALFYPRSADGELELAAAALDGLLGTALVPPTVAASVDGTDGALQLRYPGAISEAERLERHLGFTGWCPIPPQLQLLYALDVLTYNRGRTVANVLYGNDLTDLYVTDFRQAFGNERALPPGFDPRTLTIPAGLTAALAALDNDTLEATLGEWLDARQIRGLVERRDRLIAER